MTEYSPLADEIAALFRSPPGVGRLGDEPPGTIAAKVMAIVDPALASAAAHLRDALDRQDSAESSRRDWAAEADRLTEALEVAQNAMRGMVIWMPDHARRAAGWDDAVRYVGAVLNPLGDTKWVCACVTDEQADPLIAAGFSRPVCAVHPKREGK